MRRDLIVAAAGRTIRHGSKSFHMASRLFDRTTRERAWLLYCWCRHCDDLFDGQELGHRVQPVPAAAIDAEALTLQALSGQATGQLPFDALLLLLSECPIPHMYILDHLAGFALDAEGWRPKDEADLLTYCYHVAGAVGCMMAIVMGIDADDESTLASAADLGIAFQLSNIARDVREDHEAGRCYLPASCLAERGLTERGLLRSDSRDRLVAVVRRLTDLAAAYEDSARLAFPNLPFRARWAVAASARIYGSIGRRVSALGPAAWEGRVALKRREKLGFLLPSLVESLRAGRGG